MAAGAQHSRREPERITTPRSRDRTGVCVTSDFTMKRTRSIVNGSASGTSAESLSVASVKRDGVQVKRRPVFTTEPEAERMKYRSVYVPFFSKVRGQSRLNPGLFILTLTMFSRCSGAAVPQLSWGVGGTLNIFTNVFAFYSGSFSCDGSDDPSPCGAEHYSAKFNL